MDLLNWDWSATLRMISAGVGTAAVQAVMPLIRDRAQRKKQAVYLAMRIATILEAYALECTLRLQANEIADGPEFNTMLPELIAYPDEVDGWRVIDRRLADRCLNIRNRIKSSQGSIQQRIAFLLDTKDTVNEETSKRGFEAWELAVDLRRLYGLKAVELDWDYPDVLRRMSNRRARATA